MKDFILARSDLAGPTVRRATGASQTIWIVLITMIAVDAILARWIGIGISVGPAIAIGICSLIGIGFVYSALRPNLRLASFVLALAELGIFTAAAAALIYLAATANFPLIDRYLAATDAALGLDWLALFYFVKGHPYADATLCVIYLSVGPQILVLLGALCFSGSFDRAREFVWLYILTMLMIIPLSTIVPAAGAWAYYGVSHLTSDYYSADFTAIRSGTMPEVVLKHSSGIVQFPSFHASLGAILIFCSRGARVLFPLFLGLNLVMLISALTHGGHHMADVISGLALVPISISILHYFGSPRSRANNPNSTPAAGRRSDRDSRISALIDTIRRRWRS